MRLQFTTHTGNSVTLTRRQTEACERLGDEIDVEEPEGEALVADGVSEMIDACLSDDHPAHDGWCLAYRLGQTFLTSQMQAARFEWSGGRWLTLTRLPH